jgi:hypothetical protein
MGIGVNQEKMNPKTVKGAFFCTVLRMEKRGDGLKKLVKTKKRRQPTHFLTQRTFSHYTVFRLAYILYLLLIRVRCMANFIQYCIYYVSIQHFVF